MMFLSLFWNSFTGLWRLNINFILLWLSDAGNAEEMDDATTVSISRSILLFELQRRVELIVISKVTFDEDDSDDGDDDTDDESALSGDDDDDDDNTPDGNCADGK